MTSLQRRLLPSTSALAAFDAVARLGSFSTAAQELSLTQGAISRQIANLEAQLSTVLFVREGRGASLTETGRSYHAAIASALAAIRSASLDAMTRRHADTLTLAIPPTFGTRWLMPRIRGFVEKNPGITLNFATRIRPFDFAAENIDAAIYVGESVWPGADMVMLMGETVVPVCSPGFQALHRPASPADLKGLPLLHLKSRPSAWKRWFEDCGEAGGNTDGMTFEQFVTIAQACVAGLGVALLPVFLAATELQSGQLVVAVHRPTTSGAGYYLVHPKGQGARGPLATFKRWLVEEAQAFVGQGAAPDLKENAC